MASIPGVAWAAKPGGCASGVTCKGKCCAVGATCGKGAGGVCACPAGQTVCGGQCVSLTTNQNCGSCGNACSGGKTCQSGVCACPQGQTECGGVCRDLTTDVLNCGLCGNACAQGASCVGGRCACPSGQEQCAGTNACVRGCSATSGEIFKPTTCRCECPSGTTLCPGNNTCVQNCPSGKTLNVTTCQCENEVCQPGTTIGCPPGQACCDNATPEGTSACTSCGGCSSCRSDKGVYFNPITCECECLPGLVRCFGPGACCPPGATCCYKSVPGGASFAGCCPSGTGCNTAGETLVCVP